MFFDRPLCAECTINRYIVIAMSIAKTPNVDDRLYSVDGDRDI